MYTIEIKIDDPTIKPTLSVAENEHRWKLCEGAEIILKTGKPGMLKIDAPIKEIDSYTGTTRIYVGGSNKGEKSEANQKTLYLLKPIGGGETLFAEIG